MQTTRSAPGTSVWPSKCLDICLDSSQGLSPPPPGTLLSSPRHSCPPHPLLPQSTLPLNPRNPLPPPPPFPSVPLRHVGFFKPWYDMKHPPHFKPSQATGAVEFGQAYRMWWEYYEQFHVAHFQAGEEPLEGWGGKAAGQAHPSTHVWVMRHSKDQYVQRLWSEILKERDVVYEGWQLRLGHPGMCTGLLR